MNQDDFINAIKGKNIFNAKKLNDFWSIVKVIDLGVEDDLKFFFDSVYLSDYDYEFNDKLSFFIADLISKTYENGNERIFKGLSLLNAIYSLKSTKFNDKELIHDFMQYHSCQEVIKRLIELHVEIPYFYVFKAASLYNYTDLDKLLLNVLLEHDYDPSQLFSVFLSNYNQDRLIAYNEYDDKLIYDFINKHCCNINYAKCSHDFDYLVQHCFFRAPHSLKHFLKPELDLFPLEDDEFWEVFSNEIKMVDQYIQAFEDLKNSGIEFYDEVMLSVLEEAGHQQLIDAYSN